ncbi:MAG: type I-E CRISPR-associated protein Cse1/CasA [Polyangiales bacterium]
MASFDLREQPWIVVETLDRTIVERSTRAVLHDAHELRAIVDESPLVLAALTRHLLAILHRAYDGPKTVDDWLAIFRAGRFDAEKIDRYLDSDRARDRMDLFHPERPFAQTRGLCAHYSGLKAPIKPIEALELRMSNWGQAKRLFSHSSPRRSLSPARAARALLAHHAYAMHGTQTRGPNEPISASAGPLVSSAIVIGEGDNLFETLCLNLNLYDPAHHLPVPCTDTGDVCSWEHVEFRPTPHSTVSNKKVVEFTRAPFGYLDQLTWLSRRVELVGDETGISGFVSGVGKGIDDSVARDAMKVYRRSTEEGWVGIGINPDRAFWRSADALFQVPQAASAQFIRPKALDLLTTRAVHDAISPSRAFRLSALGLCMDKEKPLETTILMLRSEHVGLLADSLAQPDARVAVTNALGAAEYVASSLNRSLRLYARLLLSSNKREPKAKDVSQLAKSLNAGPNFWSHSGVLFQTMLLHLSAPSRACAEFEVAIVRLVQQVFTDVTSSTGKSGAGLQARAHAEGALDFALNKLRPNKQPAQTTPTIALAEE